MNEKMRADNQEYHSLAFVIRRDNQNTINASSFTILVLLIPDFCVMPHHRSWS